VIYLDTSVALAHLLAEDRSPPDALWEQSLVSSRLLEYELWIRLQARGLGSSHGDAARALLHRLALLELAPPVLARALAQEPRVLLLDEPTAHLDLRYQAETAGLLRRLNRERGVTILLVSHDLNLAAELSNRLLLLADGRIQMIGPPEHVINEELLEAVYGCPVHVGKNPESGRPNVQLLWPQWDKEVTEL